MKPLGIYVHIPFCLHKCAYCDFYSQTDCGKAKEYTDALVAQIKSYKKHAKGYLVDTVYIGGGTPSCIDPEHICRVMNALRATFKLAENAEISIEANPGTLDSTKLSAYRSVGINRLSMGLQSSDDDELRLLSRIHTMKDFIDSFLLARLEGFDNINVDIMYALPNQKKELLLRTVADVIELEPEHISFYGLKIEENTPFGKSREIADALPDEETQYNMYMEASKMLDEHGYLQYEISNFAKEGKACRHNLKYWHCDDYLGFGVAAASLFEGELFSYVKNIDMFIDDSASPALVSSSEMLSPKDFAIQYMMLSLRTSEGADASEYERRFGRNLREEYAEKLKPYINKRLAEKTPRGYRLTRRGMLVSNYILSDILDI